MRRVFQPKRAWLLKCCAQSEQFLTHTAGPAPPTALTTPNVPRRVPTLPPSRGEPLRPRAFSHRRCDAKSLVYCRDVSFGGVLCALPALAENGLFRHINACLKHLRGYYSTLHVILLLAH